MRADGLFDGASHDGADSDGHASQYVDRLYRCACALADVLTPQRVVEALAGELKAAESAAAVAVVAVEPGAECFRVLHAEGMAGEHADLYHCYPLNAPGPGADVARSGEAVFIEGPHALQARYPHLADGMVQAGVAASASVPVLVDGTPVAVLSLLFGEPRAFGVHGRRYLMTVAELLSQALRRTWLYESEQRARYDAEAANRAKTEFLAIMSHELRTPLNAIIGYAQLLAHGVHGELNPQQLHDVDRLQNGAQHLLSLVNHVISYAQLEREHVMLELGPVRVAELLAQVRMLVGQRVAAKTQELLVEPCDPALAVRGDGEKLALVLLNLLVNATKYTPHRGTIRVWCERQRNQVVMCVEDSGPGVPEDERERIFEPFVQLGRGLTGQQEGTGLGLAISRELARRMSGNLHIEAAPGGGARFVVTLPLWLAHEAVQARA